MLAQARCEGFAQRAALTIPEDFLPRILLCSGLSRSSVTTIIQRLGHIVDSAHDKDEVIGRLLKQRSEWNAGNIGKKQTTTKKKLLGCIAAYFRLYKISFPVVNPFLASLMEDNDFNDPNTSTKATQKKIKGTDREEVGSTYSTISFLFTLRNSEISPDDD